MSAATPDFSTLSVYTYAGALAMQSIPSEQLRAMSLPVLSALFARSADDFGVFSLTSSAEGDFIVMDASLHESLFLGRDAKRCGLPSGLQQWKAIYIHEASSDKGGAEISGALSALCEELAQAKVAVLNVCNLTRNFMLVQDHLASQALDTLRAAVERSHGLAAVASTEPASKRLKPAEADSAATKDVQITVLPGTVSVASLTSAQLKRCAHAILSIFFLRSGRSAFQHLFEIGGEVSLFVEELEVDKLRETEPASAAELDAALAPSLVRGWRVLDVTAPAGGEGVGILSAVCLPLASLPLLNVSTFDHTYILVHADHLDEALRRLKPSFDVVLAE